MGVHGLTSLLTGDGKGRHVESLAAHVASLASPELLVDGPGWIYSLCTLQQSSLLGAYAALADQVRRFVHALRAIGVQPVVFFDGVFRPQKQRTQLSRRQEDAKLCSQLYGQLLSSQAASSGRRGAHNKQSSNKMFGTILPLLAKEVVLEQLAELNVRCIQGPGEADGELARYYAQHSPNAFGILSNDSDFFILDVNFLPIDKFVALKNGDYRFVLFDRTITSDILRLKRPGHLPLLSCLVGNDYTK